MVIIIKLRNHKHYIDGYKYNVVSDNILTRKNSLQYLFCNLSSLFLLVFYKLSNIMDYSKHYLYNKRLITL